MRDLNGKKLIIQFFVMDGARRTVKNIGYCKIVGVRLGARRVDSECVEELMNQL